MFAIRDGEPIELTVDSLLASATKQSGLSDFGDMSFVVGLEKLIESLKTEGWHLLKDEMKRDIGPSLVDLLVNRLQVLDDRKKYPEIAEVKIEKPIFFIGMARSGSTLIQTLFAQDPANIAPEFWEVMKPSPPPRFGIGADRQARVAQMMDWHMNATPGFTTRHPYFIEEGYRALAECGSIGQMSFAGIQFFAFLPVPSYQDWFVNADNRHAVEFHRYFLQHLQWGREGRAWVSKSVEHGAYLEGLLEQYPDATFIWTHRDLYDQLSSITSTVAVMRQLSSRVDDMPALGMQRINAVRDIFDRTMKVRSQGNEDKFIDVFYEDMLHNPIGTIRGIYEKIGRPLNADAELNMQRWLANNNQTKHGKHEYKADEYGIDRALIESKFPDYLARFGSELKASAERYKG